MKIILEIPEKNLEILDVLARSQRRSRKALMEYILITYSESTDVKINWEQVRGKTKTDWKVKANIYHQVKHLKISRSIVAAKYNVSIPLINKIAIEVDPAITEFERATGEQVKYGKPGVIETDSFFTWRDKNIKYDNP